MPSLIHVHTGDMVDELQAIGCSTKIILLSLVTPNSYPNTLCYMSTGEYCNRTWDNIMCWMETPVGTVAKQHCPSYVSGFDTTGKYIKPRS